MFKLPVLQKQLKGLSLTLATVALVACSSDGTTIDPIDADNTAGINAPTTTTDGGGVVTSGSEGDSAGTDTGTAGSDGDTSGTTDNAESDTTGGNDSADTDGGNTSTGGDSTTDSGDTASEGDTGGNTDGNSEPSTTGGSDSEFPPANATGADQPGRLDDSPTETESASLVGPFIKDPERGNGPPSAPEDLTLLLASEEWLEFSWKPSTDDQSVEAYEIYRDNTLVYTIRGDTGYEYDYRSWISTSYIDCNKTRYTFCPDNPIVPGSSYEYRVVAVDNEGAKSEPSEPAIFQLSQSESGPADLTDYVQVFGEEFNGNTLDIAKWKTVLPWGQNKIINEELQFYVNKFGADPIPVDPYVMTGSTLQITATKTPPELLERANNQPYISGVITTSDKFEMTYGYIEMSAKVAAGEGFLSTFYMFNQSYYKNQPEIDIIEYIGNRPDKAYQTYHYYDSNRARFDTGERHSTPTMETQVSSNLSEGFHTYSVLWEEGLAVFYIDDVEVRRLTGVRIADEPMNIIAQLVVGSEWIGAPNAASLPNTYEIDYIRAFQKQ